MACDIDYKMKLIVEVLGGCKISKVAQKNDVLKRNYSAGSVIF